jgi:hypothetical protein
VVAAAYAQEPQITDPTRAPFRAANPAGRAAAEDGAWILHSTRVSASDRVAVINGSIVGVGNRIGGAEVLEIQAGRVRLRQGANTFTLRLERPSVKGPAASGEP